MRELFEEAMGRSPLDPNEAARETMRTPLRRRFYKAVTVEARPNGFAIALDGKMMRTPARQALMTPYEGIAVLLAAEWDAQREHINPARMPLTRLTNSILDGVMTNAAAVAGDIARYFESDLLLYRASHPQALVARQSQSWDPVVDWAGQQLGGRFTLTEGVMHVAQDSALLAAGRAMMPADPWALGALHSATTLLGSVLLALAIAQGRLRSAEAWAAAHLDEDWNFEQWGADEAVLARRAAKFTELEAAAVILAAARS